jgi:hypothetical protein
MNNDNDDVSLTLKGVYHIYIIPLDELIYEARVLLLGHMTQVARWRGKDH